jgi:hypothetical protein
MPLGQERGLTRARLLHAALSMSLWGMNSIQNLYIAEVVRIANSKGARRGVLNGAVLRHVPQAWA